MPISAEVFQAELVTNSYISAVSVPEFILYFIVNNQISHSGIFYFKYETLYILYWKITKTYNCIKP